MSEQALQQLRECANALEALRQDAESNRLSHDRAYGRYLDIKYLCHESWAALAEGEWDQAKAIVNPTKLAQLEQAYNPGNRR